LPVALALRLLNPSKKQIRIIPFRQRGNIVEAGALGYAEERGGFLSDLFSKKEERNPVEGEMLAKGSYKAQGEPGGILRLIYPQKNKNLTQVIQLGETYHQYYKWMGDIMFSGKTHKANFLIDADGAKDGWNKTILLDTAKNEFYSFEFSGPIGSMSFDAEDPEIPNFPWWVGDFIAQDKTYRLDAVVEIGLEYDYTAFPKPFPVSSAFPPCQGHGILRYMR
jgi:hypothetical protein